MVAITTSTMMNEHSNAMKQASTAAATTVVATSPRPPTKHKRRFCRIEGCDRIVKSQGLCQRHGAKPCKCKVPGCGKQAQGNFGGMCKAHFRQGGDDNVQDGSPGITKGKPTFDHQGVTTEAGLYPVVLPQPAAAVASPPSPLSSSDATASQSHMIDKKTGNDQFHPRVLSYHPNSAYALAIPASIAWEPQTNGGSGTTVMPLLACLQKGQSGKPAGWHRVEERAARNLSASAAGDVLEPWELELLFIEILILTGQGRAAFTNLAHAWAQPDGFHLNIGRQVCGVSTNSGNATATTEEANEVSSEEESTGTESQRLVTTEGLPTTKVVEEKSADSSRSPLDTLIALLTSSGD